MQSEKSFVERSVVSIGNIVRWSVLALVIITVVDVFLRYFLKAGNIALQELEWHLFAVLFLFGSASTLASDQHVRVDVLYSRFSQRGKTLINVFGSLFFLLPFCLVVVWASSGFVMQSFEVMEGSADPGGLPFRFLAKAMIPIGFSLLIVMSLAQVVAQLKTLFANKDERR